MHFTKPMHHRHHHGTNSNDEQHHFELSQYTPMGVQHFSSQYKHDPKALEKLSKRICARVEQDSSDLITFCDKRIRKRRKKKRLEDERRIQNDLSFDDEDDNPAAPEVVAASDLILGNCLGQGSFSSVFVLEKHMYTRKPASNPRRGRRSKHSRHARSVSKDKSTSNHSSIGAADNNNNNNNNSTSNRSSTRSASSQTPGLRRRLRKRVPDNDASNRSTESNSSQRSRSLSLPRNNNRLKRDPSGKRLVSQDDEILNSPIRVLRSPTKRMSASKERTRSRSLSSSIQNGLRAVFRSNSTHSNRQTGLQEEDCEVPLARAKTFRKSKSQHARPQYEEDNSRSGRSIFRGGSRSLSCHQGRKSRRSRSRGDENDAMKTGAAEDCDDTTNNNKSGVLFNPDCTIGGDSNLVVKILQPKLMNQPKLFANCAAGLIREGLFLAAINHPHVLKVHAWTSPNGWMDFASLASKEGDLYDSYMLVLERLTGGSLKGWMRKWQAEHAREQKELAAVAAMEAAEEKKRQEKSERKRLGGLARRLSFTGSSRDRSGSFSFSNSNSSNSNLLRHTVLRRRGSLGSKHNRTCVEGAKSLLSSPQSETTVDSTYSNCSSSGRSFPYECKWPTTQLSDRMSLLMQLSDTVKYLHKHRILHRDLKPDNLGVTFVDPLSNTNSKKQYPSNLSLKVFDFDIARLVPKEEKEDRHSKKKKNKKRGVSVDASVKSCDPEIFNSNRNSSRSGRSMSPIRSSSSLTGADPTTMPKRTKKYRGKRPEPTNNIPKPEDSPRSPVPTIISATFEEPEAPRGEDALFQMTAKMGSPRYMAPEIARGDAYNLKSEVYTVCLLVHEVLTLQKPYDELAPEDHGKLVHFDIPGYRPPINPEWEWPAELEEVLHLGWGEIAYRPSMKDVHSVLKKALPKICPALLRPKSDSVAAAAAAESVAPETVATPSLIGDLSTPHADHCKKAGRTLFHHQSHKKSKSKSHGRSSSLTPTASNSDFSFSNDEPLAVNVAQ